MRKSYIAEETAAKILEKLYPKSKITIKGKSNSNVEDIELILEDGTVEKWEVKIPQFRSSEQSLDYIKDKYQYTNYEGQGPATMSILTYINDNSLQLTAEEKIIDIPTTKNIASEYLKEQIKRRDCEKLIVVDPDKDVFNIFDLNKDSIPLKAYSFFLRKKPSGTNKISPNSLCSKDAKEVLLSTFKDAVIEETNGEIRVHNVKLYKTISLNDKYVLSYVDDGYHILRKRGKASKYNITPVIKIDMSNCKKL